MDSNTVYNLLDLIKEKSYLYIDKKELILIKTFIEGYIHGLIENEIYDINNTFGKFNYWIQEKYDSVDTMKSWYILICEDKENEEDRVKLFFELLEEYKNQLKYRDIDDIKFPPGS